MQLQYWKYKRYTFAFYIPLSTVKMWKKTIPEVSKIPII